ncbi:MAG TPA: PepSY-associated TM helix domain-containing protein [Hyphomicrobiales bacterium]|nr:PepSY-associated TM helix domain-containing protein [Hyphomicrobiales bacterium]
MKTGALQSLAWLHTWSGLVVGWLLFAVCFTGSLAVFHREISHWMQPELQVNAAEAEPSLRLGEAYLRRHAAQAPFWSIRLPSAQEPALELSWQQDGASFTHFLDAQSGRLLVPRPSEGGEFLVELHYSFHAGTPGLWLVGLCGIVMLLAGGSGIVIHRRLFKDFFTFRPRAGAQRSWLDAHNLLGVLALPFHLMIAYTGLIASAWTFLPAAFNTLYDGNLSAYFLESAQTLIQPPEAQAMPMVSLTQLLAQAEAHFGMGQVASLLVLNPDHGGATVQVLRQVGDQVALAADRLTFDGISGTLLQVVDTRSPAQHSYTVLAGLHYAQFGGAPVRWLYFFLGLASCAMIATGLVLFSIKRREKHQRDALAPSRAYAVIERCNVLAVAGFLNGVAAYFWANRLLPLSLPGREGWEIATLFLVWLATLPHALLRPARCAWIEQLASAGLLCLLLPLLNGLTTEAHLLHSLQHGRWAMASVDLSFMATGGLLMGIAWKLAEGRILECKRGR